MAATNSTLTAEYCNACVNGDFDTVKKYVEQGVDINGEYAGSSPFRMACMENRQDIVKYLIEKGVDVATSNGLNTTGLIYAAGRGHVKIVELLLEQNSSLNFIRHQSEQGWTALILAAIHGHEDVVKLLLFYDPSEEHILIKDSEGKTAIDHTKTEKMRGLLSTPFNHQFNTKRAKPGFSA